MPLFDAANGAVGRLDERSGTVHLTYTDALVSTDPWPTLRVSLDVRAPISDAVHENRVVVCNSRAELAARYPDLAYRMVGEWEASAAVPVVGTAGVLGVLGIALPPGRVFDAADRGFLEVIGSVVGQAAARAELFERERTRRRLSEAFRRASAEIASSRPEDVATVIGRRVAATLDARWYGVYVREGDVLRLLDDKTDGRPLRTELRLDQAFPTTDAIHTRAPVVLADAEEWTEHYTAMRTFPTASGPEPAAVDEFGRCRGRAGLGFPSEPASPRPGWSSTSTRSAQLVRRVPARGRHDGTGAAGRRTRTRHRRSRGNTPLLGRPDPDAVGRVGVRRIARPTNARGRLATGTT
jgi:hypothetical protein